MGSAYRANKTGDRLCMQTSLKPKLPNRADLQTEQRSWLTEVPMLVLQSKPQL